MDSEDTFFIVHEAPEQDSLFPAGNMRMIGRAKARAEAGERNYG